MQLIARFGSTAASATGVTSIYNGFGGVSSTSTNQSGAARALNYGYDLEGNRTKVTHPDGNNFGYSYDGLNRLSQITEDGSAVLLTAAYDNQGRRATLTRGGPTGAGVSSTTYLYHLVSRQQTLAQDLDGPRRGC